MKKLFSFFSKNTSSQPLPNSNKIFILGNQKSGTTIISKLIEQATSEPTLHDFPPKYYNRLSDLSEEKVSFDRFMKYAKKAFKKHRIIKEPQLSFSVSSILESLPDAKILLIVRDPRDNIRSLLNRVEVKGNLKELNIDDLDVIPAWKKILKSQNIGATSTHYIENLAFRWNKVYENYRENQERIILVRYEDFLVEKVETIKQICTKLDLPYKNDISDKVDIQYQKKGNQNVNIEAFFGEENLKIINTSCQEGMSFFGYD